MLTLANGALALTVEVAMLVGVGRAVFIRLDHGVTGWVGAVLAVLVVAAVWSLWAAPASRHRLDLPWLLVLKAGNFTLGTWAWWSAGPGWVWPVIGLAAVLSLALGLATQP